MKLDLGNIVQQTFTRLKNETINYTPLPHMMENHRLKAFIGGTALAGTYIIPGDQPILTMLALAYGGVKGYQAVRDWANK
ncbi:hypothetical protein HQ533_05625 [Candidatus Woesearchaeota archaeon]|nr:hypothetical protein [Candidatus Woesearchaeota archaeon]